MNNCQASKTKIRVKNRNLFESKRALYTLEEIDQSLLGKLLIGSCINKYNEHLQELIIP